MDEGGEAYQADVSDQPFETSFHPSANVFAASLITGAVEVFEYGEGTNKVKALKPHNDSCRTVKFSPDGRVLISASLDMSIVATDCNTAQEVGRLDGAHSAGVNTIAYLNPTSIASGDDDGTMKVWDLRQQSCVYTFDEVHEDFCSDLWVSQETQQLLTTSGDGTLSCVDLRTGKLVEQSDNQEDELMSLVVLKEGKKVVTGSTGGILSIWNYGRWGDITDRYPGHPNSIDTLVKIDEDTIFTGSSDGIIRIVSILPNKLVGVVGEHMDSPIEHLAFSSDRRYLASASHDNTIKLWDVAFITLDDDGDDDDQGEAGATSAGPSGGDADMDADGTGSESDASRQSKKKKGKKGKGNQGGGKANFFEDLL
mmetsp:Transcript_43090/g.52256  ORF Transcript_43090/g.52256 Transcript_43090/m.52256 type:complete len:368 (+) Transcript_43090:76-1179(+)